MKAVLRIFLMLLSLLPIGAVAQNDVQFTDYTRLKSYYNPAASGTDGKLNVASAYSMQFVGYDNAPATMYVGADLPIFFLSPRHGAGVSLLSDKFGMFSTQKISLQYAYNLRIGKKGRLAIGVQGAILMEKIDPSGLKFETDNDPVLPSSEVNGQHLDLAAGLYYYHPKLWLGLSSHHLAEPVIELGERNEYATKRMYYLMGGCNISLKNTFLSLQPSFMVMSDMQSWREDVQCRLAYDYEGRSFYAGVGYSPDVSATFMVGGNFHGVSLGYSYQMYTTGVGLINGSHEITVGYKTDLDFFKKGRNRHKSVRFL